MEPTLTTSVFVYLVISSYFFTNWLKFFKRKSRLSPEEIFLSFVILVVATILWPVVVPISYLELLKARTPHSSRIIPIAILIDFQMRCILI